METATPKAKNLPRGKLAYLSAQIGYSRDSIRAWRFKYADEAPQVEDTEGWKRFILEKGLGVAPNKVANKREGLLEERIKRETRLLDIKIAAAERKVVDRVDIDALHKQIALKQKSLLFQVLGRELGGRCVGKSATEINKIGKEIALRLCGIFAEGLDSWQSD